VVLALAGIAERANELVVYLRGTPRNDEPPGALLEGIARERLNAQPGTVGVNRRISDDRRSAATWQRAVAAQGIGLGCR
jgi:hypothetical protein